MKYCFGADVGGTSVKLGLFDENGTLVDKWEIPTRTQNEGEAVIADIAESVLGKIEEKEIDRGNITGIGIGIPAPVTYDGLSGFAANIGWKQGKEVTKELGQLTGLKVFAGNDANVAALGEMWKGAGYGAGGMVLVTLGTGVGGGIIINGRIFMGAGGAAGEIGHICVDPNETETCGCGRRGCLEQYASATGIVRLAKRKLAKETRHTLLNKDAVTAKDVFDSVKAGDEVACEIADEFGNYMGRGLADIAAVLDPSLIVIGGGVSKAGGVLLEYIEKGFKKYALAANEKVRFALASLGNDAGIYGCAALVLGNNN